MTILHFLSFFFNATATSEFYTLSLHDALPIFLQFRSAQRRLEQLEHGTLACALLDRKSTRLNSSHLGISYAVFCLKKKNLYRNETNPTRGTKLIRSRTPIN